MAYPEDPDKPAKMKLAVELREKGHSLTYIGQKIGKSHTTVRKYIEEGQKEAEWAFLLDSAQDKAALRAFLETLTDMLVTELPLSGKLALDYVPVILQVLDRRAKLVGTWAPKQTQISDLREPPSVDPVTEQQVTAALEQVDRGDVV